MAKKRIAFEVAGREVSISSPDKVYFPEAGLTKLDLIQYYLAVAEGALRGVMNRPFVMKRFVNGIGEDPFYQKRVPKTRPEWTKTVTLSFPSGRKAEELVIDHPAALIWCAQMGCLDLNPHAIRADDLEHPDELRIDLDPVPGVEWAQIRDVAMVTRESLDAQGLVGWPKTSGSRGIHIYVRIERKWGFDDVRRAALAVARDVEKRAPKLATAAWWKEERHGVFLDYNQNAKDKTVASAYSVRPRPDARVSAPLTWEELADCDPADFTMKTMPARFATGGDPHAGIDDAAFSLEALLELAHRQDAEDGPARETSSVRRARIPLVTVAQAKKKEDALAGLERWKAKHPKAAACLEPADVLVDAMRGRYTTWTRIRLNLRNVPEAERPAQATPDPDYDPRVEWEKSS